MESVKRAVVDNIESAFERAVFEAPPPPLPPPPPSPVASIDADYAAYLDYAGVGGPPDILDFAGAALFFVCFFSSVVDVLESEEFRHVLTFQEYEYTGTPIFLTLGLTVGFYAYCLSYLQVPHFAIQEYGHLALVAVMFAFWSRHLCKVNALSKKRTNILMSFGLLPLICLVMIKGEHVSVRSKKLLYLVVMCVSSIPLPQLFRDWRTNIYDAAGSKHKKRLFYFYFVLLLYVGISTPVANKHFEERNATIGLAFDLTLLYLAVDSLWIGR
jgi:hypothetical protein